jgi:hypothetical protein
MGHLHTGELLALKRLVFRKFDTDHSHVRCRKCGAWLSERERKNYSEKCDWCDKATGYPDFVPITPEQRARNSWLRREEF